MTRQEFIDNIDDYYELRDFCQENDSYEFDDIIDQDSFDEYVNDNIWNNRYDWRDLQEWLNNIPTGYYFYDVINGVFDAVGLSDENFESDKDEILQKATNKGWFDEEEPEEDSDEDEDNDNKEEDSEMIINSTIFLEILSHKKVVITNETIS